MDINEYFWETNEETKEEKRLRLKAIRMKEFLETELGKEYENLVDFMIKRAITEINHSKTTEELILARGYLKAVSDIKQKTIDNLKNFIVKKGE